MLREKQVATKEKMLEWRIRVVVDSLVSDSSLSNIPSMLLAIIMLQ